MAEKFSTVTAAGPVGAWRQFSGAMQQLQESKGAITQVVAPKFDPEKFNLAGSLLDVIGGAEDTYKNIKQVADKNAEEWAKGKSFSEVAADMKENRVPFQYDPFAMASLATIQGRNAFEVGVLEFEERLKSSEFVDKSPEEIDQIFIDTQRNVLKDIGEAHGKMGDSGAFHNGFWSDANKTREYVWKTSETVKNDYHKQQGLIAAESQINDLLDGDVDSLYEGLTLISQSGMIGRTPEDQMKMAKSVVESLSKHRYGADKIQLLADKDIPGLTPGTTYRSLFGDATIDAAIVQAENVRMVSDFDSWRVFNDELNTMVSEGDIVGLRAMQQMYADRADGMTTKYVEAVQSGLDTVARNQAKGAAKSTALAKEQVRQLEANNHVMDVLSGRKSGTDSPAGQTLYDPNTGDSLGTISHEEMQMHYNKMFMSGNLTPDNVDNMLTDPDGQKMFKNLFGDIEGKVKGDVQSVIDGVMTPADTQEPEGFRQIMSYVERDPKRVSGIVGYDQADTIGLLGYLMSGIPYQQYVASRAQFEKKDIKYKWEAELPINTGDYSVDNNDYETMYVRRLALALTASGVDPNQAIKDARTGLKDTHQLFTYQSPHKDKGTLWDSSRDEVEAYIPTKFYHQFLGFTPEEVNTRLTDFISKIEKDYNEKDLYFSYDPLSNAVRVYDPRTMNTSYTFDSNSITPYKTRQPVAKSQGAK